MPLGRHRLFILFIYSFSFFYRISIIGLFVFTQTKCVRNENSSGKTKVRRYCYTIKVTICVWVRNINNTKLKSKYCCCKNIMSRIHVECGILNFLISIFPLAELNSAFYLITYLSEEVKITHLMPKVRIDTKNCPAAPNYRSKIYGPYNGFSPSAPLHSPRTW